MAIGTNIFACFGDALGSSEIDRHEIVNSLCRIAADDELCGQTLRRRRRRKRCY
jgi:hypothetical protein